MSEKLVSETNPGILTTKDQSQMTQRETFAPTKRVLRPSFGTLLWLTILWVLFWGDLTWGNVVAGLGIGIIVSFLAQMPRTTTKRRFTLRPIAFLNLVLVFAKDVVLASWQITTTILARRQPNGAIIKVNLRAHSDSFLAATAALTALVPGSIVVNVHRLTGIMYVHVFDVDASGGLAGAKQVVYIQEERLLRALGTKEELLDAGFVPGGSMKLGRISDQTKKAVTE